jgi:hypothetical protein
VVVVLSTMTKRTQEQTKDPTPENNRERICRGNGESGSYE